MKEIINHDTLRIEMQMSVILFHFNEVRRTEMQISVILFHFNEVRRLLVRRHLIRYSPTCIVNSIS